MKALWDDLCQHEEALPVHEWQKDILNEREQMIGNNESKFTDWEEAKKHITRETS